MFFLPLAAVMVVFYFFMLMRSHAHLYYFFDPVTLLLLFILTFPVLVQTGLLKDFNNSFRLTLDKKRKASFKEVKRAVEAIELVRKTLWYVTAFLASISCAVILWDLSDLAALGPQVSSVVLGIFYTAFFNIILFPMEKQLMVRLLEFDEKQVPEPEGQKKEEEKE